LDPSAPDTVAIRPECPANTPLLRRSLLGPLRHGNEPFVVTSRIQVHSRALPVAVGPRFAQSADARAPRSELRAPLEGPVPAEHARTFALALQVERGGRGHEARRSALDVRRQRVLRALARRPPGGALTGAVARVPERLHLPRGRADRGRADQAIVRRVRRIRGVVHPADVTPEVAGTVSVANSGPHAFVVRRARRPRGERGKARRARRWLARGASALTRELPGRIERSVNLALRGA
jgi:hypothetical protein